MLIAGLIAVGAVVAGVALFSTSPYGDEGSGLDPRFDYTMPVEPIDPALIGYEQIATHPLVLREPRAVATAVDHIHVAGDRAIHILGADGSLVDKIPLDAEPTAITLAPSRPHLYIALGDRIAIHHPDGQHNTTWPAIERGVFTSIAVGDDAVYVADAGNKVVWRYDHAGNVIGEIGRRDPDAGIPGFVIPSPYFDVALGRDGLLRAVNPGGHRIEVYTPDGRLETPLVWGRGGSALDRFCGCCNPVAIALMPDGRIVTAEKGIPRVKVYRDDGTLDSVVAGPELLSPRPSAMEETREEHQLRAMDLAVDAEGRVLVLDPAARMVRVFSADR
jgi:hypothetical protein